jgi:hypothetical protein
VRRQEKGHGDMETRGRGERELGDKEKILLLHYPIVPLYAVHDSYFEFEMRYPYGDKL